MKQGRRAFACAAALFIHAGVLAAEAPANAPAPGALVQQWSAAEGVLELKTPAVGCMSGKESQLTDIAAKLVADAAGLGLGNWTITQKLDASIWLRTGKVEGSDSPDACAIEIGSAVFITGNAPAGVAQGARILLEMLAKDKTRHALPCGTLVALPAAAQTPAAAPPPPAATATPPATAANASQAPASAAPPVTQIDAAFTVPPYLQDLRTNEVTVMWWTAGGTYGWVEYGESEALGKRADSVIDGMREVTAARHAVRLPGLTPGTRYCYRTGLRSIISYKKNSVRWTGDTYSPVYSFTTPPSRESRVRCVIVNDTHNDPGFAPLLALPGVKPFDFSIFNGDCFAELGSLADALALLRSYTAAVDGASRPAVFVRGNRDLRNTFATQLRNLFTYPGDRCYFAFTRGPVRFVVLDCGEDKRDADPAYGGTVDFTAFRAEVRDWLSGEIASAAFRQAKWHVLIHHIPLYGPGASELSRAYYVPVLTRATFDLAINGYTHQAATLKRGTYQNPYPVVTGGGPGAAATVTVFEATTTGWKVTVVNRAGKVLVEERGAR